MQERERRREFHLITHSRHFKLHSNTQNFSLVPTFTTALIVYLIHNSFTTHLQRCLHTDGQSTTTPLTLCSTTIWSSSAADGIVVVAVAVVVAVDLRASFHFSPQPKLFWMAYCRYCCCRCCCCCVRVNARAPCDISHEAATNRERASMGSPRPHCVATVWGFGNLCTFVWAVHNMFGLFGIGMLWFLVQAAADTYLYYIMLYKIHT